MTADIIDQIVMLCAGIWMTCVGFGYLAVPGNPAVHPAWVKTVSAHFKWMGPLLMAIAIFLMVAKPA